MKIIPKFFSFQGFKFVMVKFPFKKILLAVALLLTFGLGILITRWFFLRSEKVEKEDVTVLLEQIKKVAKLVTVEGYFSEIYDYQDYWGYDLSFLKKKALIKVKAKVSVGYDLEKMRITPDPERKVFVISDLPPAEILSIEHDLEYYDVQESLLNSFTTEDYNKLNANAKEFIRQKVMESDLAKTAAEQRNDLFQMMQFMAESAGWTVEIQEAEAGFQLDTLMQ